MWMCKFPTSTMVSGGCWILGGRDYSAQIWALMGWVCDPLWLTHGKAGQIHNFWCSQSCEPTGQGELQQMTQEQTVWINGQDVWPELQSDVFGSWRMLEHCIYSIIYIYICCILLLESQRCLMLMWGWPKANILAHRPAPQYGSNRFWPIRSPHWKLLRIRSLFEIPLQWGVPL